MKRLALVLLSLPLLALAQSPPSPAPAPAPPATAPAVAAPMESAAPAAPVPVGKVTLGTFSDSKIFPGTTRRYWVYVPAQYDPATPACVYIGQDNMKPQFPAIFDQLIATHQIPVTVGVFVSPGIIATPVVPGKKPQIIRTNRSFEYNSLGDDYARFLQNEFLPFIAHEMKLNLSTSGNDRCIGGGSSGASIAFTSAWEHPEWFSRVFSVSGAFPFARGDCYSGIVRKTEAKPIRLYLHVGKNDMYNANGDLFMDNEKLNSALIYTGYDVQYAVSDGKHMDKYVDVFSDALAWLWHGWPAPITAGAGSPEIQQILVKDQPWKPVAGDFGSIGGLTVDSKGDVLASDTGSNKINRVGADGQVTTFAADAHHVGALTVAADGTIYGVSKSTGDVVAFDAQGQGRVVATGLPGAGIVAARSGGLYVSVPGPAGTAESKIWYIPQQGAKTVVDAGLKAAAGMAISADGWLLNVADHGSHFVYSYRINSDGTLSDRESFNWLERPDTADTSAPDGVAVDAQGVLFVATNLGVQTCGAQGGNGSILPLPGGPATGVIFGGAGFDTLYAACGDKLFSRPVKVRGVNAFQPPSKFADGKWVPPAGGP